MNILREPIDIIFRQINPDELYEQLLKGERNLKNVGISSRNIPLDTFFRNSYNLQDHYSPDEIDYVHDYFSEKAIKTVNSKGNADKSIFYLLPNFTDDILEFKQGNPYCDKNAVFRWRNLSFRLGQDLFTTAHLAYQDYCTHGNTTYFAWPTIAHVDNPVVKEVMQKGVAENHFHLNGSVPPFAISWICLMNYPDDIYRLEKVRNIQKEFERDMVPTIHYNSRESHNTWVKRLQLACWIRIKLFKWIIEDGGKGDNGEKEEEIFHKFERLGGERRGFLRKRTNTLTRIYGADVFLHNGKKYCLDYAFPKHLNDDKNNSYFRALAGERFLLYRCFKKSYDGSFSPLQQDVLYLYLLLKSSFRNELIQVNQKVGFRNFQDYQKRKDILWEHHPEYVAEAYRIAINANQKDQNIISQENRITPMVSRKQILDKIFSIDRNTIFMNAVVTGNKHKYTHTIGEYCSRRKIYKSAKELDSFYVLHFAKGKSRKERYYTGLYPVRNKQIRRTCQRQALAIADSLNQYPHLRYRIRGIDACANEIGCRPETFATEFRFLRGYRLSNDTSKKWMMGNDPSPYLSVTYHAGEDFLDLADGMRAIDEAYTFLELKCGDRIGHALAMGVDPNKHYDLKSWRIITTKQDRLDDLVWILYRSHEWSVHIPLDLYRDLEEEAELLLDEIYGDIVRENNWRVTPRDYFHSWLLRGDHPDYYTRKEREESKGYIEENRQGGYHSIRGQYLLFKEQKKRHLPKNEEIRGIVHYYHYDKSVREKGYEKYSKKISKAYCNLICLMQDALIHQMTKRGIYVECNPSSNYLIGTFSMYKEHPVFRFNEYRKTEGNHLCVSLNTDDMGVFDTSIDNEYALIAAAMEDIVDEQGNRKYSDDDILDYLERLRVMGIRQVFPSI